MEDVAYQKICTGCKEEKSIDSYNKGGRLSDGSPKYKSKCKDCTKSADKNYREKNLEVRKEVEQRTFQQRLDSYSPTKEKFYNFLKENPCVDCGESDILFLECDHVRGQKTMSVGKMLARFRSWKEIQEEIAKCEVRCIKCHRLATATRANWNILKYR